MARPEKYKKHKYRYVYSGRVTKFSEAVVKKLEEAFAVGANVKQACYYANISKQTYYNWIDEFPALLDRFDDLRERLPLRALQNIAAEIEGIKTNGNIGLSQWLLERRQSSEYGEKLKIEHDGEVGGFHPEDEEARLRLKEILKTNIAKRWKDKKQNDENNTGKTTSV